MREDQVSNEISLARFNKLIQELLRGTLSRNTFQPWEIELLLDLESCAVPGRSRRELLRRYQRATAKAMENGARRPVRFSDFVECKSKLPQPLASPDDGVCPAILGPEDIGYGLRRRNDGTTS